MTTLLPSPVALFSSAVPSGQDPLGYMLSRVLSETRFGSFAPQEAVWGILSVLSQAPFDPHAVVRDASREMPPLTGALKLVNPNSPRRYNRPWPTALSEFTSQLLTSYENAFGQTHVDQVDGEWLAALLLAAGADPWADCGKDVYEGLGSPLHTALGLGAAGMARRLWSVEHNRPSVETLATAMVGTPYIQSELTTGTWLELSMGHPGHELAQWLLEIGVRPLADRAHPAAWATNPRHLQVFQDHGLLPVEPAERRALENAWRARLKKGSLKPEALVAFQEMLSPAVLNQEDRQAQTVSASFDQIVAEMKWDTTSYYHTATRLGVEPLCQTAAIPKGPLMGQWNRLGVELVRQLKIQNKRGVVAWDLSEMVGRSDGGRLEKAHGLDGALAAARGVEWRPGVCLDGLLALTMLGMSDSHQRNPLSYLFGGKLQDQVLIDTAASILGVADVKAWAKEHVESAVALTEALAKGGSAPACTRLQQIWASALQRHPTWLEGRPDLSLRLLQAITYNFQRVQLLELNDKGNRQVSLSKNSNTGLVIDAIWPGVSTQEPPKFAELAPAQRSLAVEIALMVHDQPWLNALREGVSCLSSVEIKRVEVFEAYARKYLVWNTIEGKPLSNHMREILLEGQLPAPAVSTSKPRF